MKIPSVYIRSVKSRSKYSYLKGLVARYFINIKYSFFRYVARRKGATIGSNTNLNWSIAKTANSNLVVGSDCIIEAKYIDLRGSKVIIDNHVIINRDVEIIRVSHFIDDDKFFTTKYYPDLKIESYTWIATGTKILPQVTLIGEGVVCGAYSVIVRNCDIDSIYAGNPAKYIKKHTTRFEDLVVCSLQGGDYNYYKEARKK